MYVGVFRVKWVVFKFRFEFFKINCFGVFYKECVMWIVYICGCWVFVNWEF